MMKAQKLYDLREKYEFCSGIDLHDFFYEQIGDPSPSGHKDIDDEAARMFVLTGCDTIEWNSPSISMAECRQAIA